jgi:hypothetical protein
MQAESNLKELAVKLQLYQVAPRRNLDAVRADNRFGLYVQGRLICKKKVKLRFER